MKWAALVLAAAAIVVPHPTRADAPPNFAIHDAPIALPEIRFEDGDGHARKLAEFRGRIVLLNIWATWCLPCRREMPTLDRLQAELGGPDFQVVALSIDRGGVEIVRKFYTEIGMQHIAIYLDASGAAFQALSVVGLPTTILIDREGSEVGRLIGPADWDTPEMIAFLKSKIARQAGALPAALQPEKDL